MLVSFDLEIKCIEELNIQYFFEGFCYKMKKCTEARECMNGTKIGPYRYHQCYLLTRVDFQTVQERISYNIDTPLRHEKTSSNF